MKENEEKDTERLEIGELKKIRRLLEREEEIKLRERAHQNFQRIYGGFFGISSGE